MTRLSIRERLARERLIAAELAIAELEHTFNEPPAADSDAMRELTSARKALYQIVVGRGRQV